MQLAWEDVRAGWTWVRDVPGQLAWGDRSIA